MSSNLDKDPCPGCSTFLIEPFIRCMQCPLPQPSICLHCFAKGVEFGDHKNDHCYEVVKHDFPVLDKSWTAADELALMNAMSECGIGNWTDVSHQVQTKSKFECESHYAKCYIHSQHPEMPAFENDSYDFQPAPVPVRFSEDPPRPLTNSTLQHYMAGYMAARGDFTAEHDNFAEMDIKDIEFTDSDDEVAEEVKLTIIDIFNTRLRERERRKKIIRDYGLISMNKVQACNRRYERHLPFIDSLKVFIRLMSPLEFDKFLEGLNYEYELRKEIKSLQEFREAGISLTSSGCTYRQLQARREAERGKRHSLNDVLTHLQYQDETACANWLHRQAALDNLSKGLPANLPAASRRVMLPLDIVGLPGFEKVNEKEKALCSTVRLVPDAYLQYKAILEEECKKQGCLKLAQARTMLKIDVNKTRKLYDYLVREGHLNKDPAP